MTSKKLTRATIERSFFNLVFLNSLNIRKHYYKPQQFCLKPTTENDTVSCTEPASFLWKHFFQEHFQEDRGFLEILKQVFRTHFPEFLPTYFPLTINY